MTIYGIYIRSIFFDEQSGMQVFLLKPQGTECKDYQDADGNIKIYGRLCLKQKYLPLKLKGKFRDSNYGTELIAETIEVHAISMEDTEMYLEENTKLLRRSVRKVLIETGCDIFSASRKEGIETEVSEKTGVDQQKVILLFKKVRGTLTELDLHDFLLEYGGTYEQCKKIVSAFPEKSLEDILDDPYETLGKGGVPFATVDRIALSVGVQSVSPMRIEAVSREIVRENMNAGNVYLTLEDLCQLADRIGNGIPKPVIAAYILTNSGIVDDPDSGIYYGESMLTDKKKDVKNFSKHPDVSNRQVAKAVSVSDHTVAKMNTEFAGAETPLVQNVQGADDKSYPSSEAQAKQQRKDI